jgi:transcriptional regulator with XRE-family HTH domain
MSIHHISWSFLMRKGLIELRKSCGLTQIEVAERLRVDQTTVSKWENGGALPRADMLFLIAELYGVAVDDIALDWAGRLRDRFSLTDGRFNTEKSIDANSE